ncbi:MAG: methyltransferase domain-containing protein [Pseudomonadota bacterium]
MKDVKKLRLNLGCGHQRPAGWHNADCSLNALLQRIPLLGNIMAKVSGATEYHSHNVHYIDIAARWRFGNGDVDVVYASHVLEHLSLRDANHFLQEASRVLRPDGVLRLVVPDLLATAREYIAESEQGVQDAAANMLAVLNLHRDNAYSPTSHWLHRACHALQGWPHQHKYMYDHTALQALFEQHGFREIRKCSYAQSVHLPEVTDVENTAEGVPSLYLEALK